MSLFWTIVFAIITACAIMFIAVFVFAIAMMLVRYLVLGE